MKEISETQNEIQNMDKGEILKAVRFYFLGVDVVIKIPLLIFIPLYQAVNVAYGPEVSKELTPLWDFRTPACCSFYLDALRDMCTLVSLASSRQLK